MLINQRDGVLNEGVMRFVVVVLLMMLPSPAGPARTDCRAGQVRAASHPNGVLPASRPIQHPPSPPAVSTGFPRRPGQAYSGRSARLGPKGRTSPRT